MSLKYLYEITGGLSAGFLSRYYRVSSATWNHATNYNAWIQYNPWENHWELWYDDPPSVLAYSDGCTSSTSPDAVNWYRMPDNAPVTIIGYDPVPIGTVEELQAIRTNTYSVNADYEQLHDIDASATAGWNPSGGGFLGFNPIGGSTSSNRFKGSFNGKGHRISDLYIHRPTTDQVGLFGYVGGYAGGFMIEQVKLIDPVVTGRDNVGSLIGRIQGDNTIPGILQNCYVEGAAVVGIGLRTGGIVGTCWPHSADQQPVQMEDCHITDSVITGEQQVGGVIGTAIMWDRGPVKHCSAKNVQVTGKQACGLFVGNPDTSFEDCHADGILTILAHDNVRRNGGFSATANNYRYLRCSAVATVHIEAPIGDQETEFGGFSARNNNGQHEDCFARFMLASGEALVLGGYHAMLVDVAGPPRMKRCYAQSGITDAKGFIDDISLIETPGNFEVEDCYFEGPAEGEMVNSHGATALRPAAMKDKASFDRWNFRTLWDTSLLVNDGYPFLNPRKLQSGYPGLYLSLFRRR